jgi:DNA-binding XRE family transcriptional regulator
VRLRELRVARGWSQGYLAELTGLSVRTIQRIENGANPGLESLRNLAAVFGVEVGELQAEANGEARPMSMFDAVSHCLRNFSDIHGVAGRAEFWWFALAVGLAIEFGALIGPWLSGAIAVLAVVPLLSAATRRLRDAGESPWWLLMLPVPIGGLVVLGVLLARPSSQPQERHEVTTT